MWRWLLKSQAECSLQEYVHEVVGYRNVWIPELTLISECLIWEIIMLALWVYCFLHSSEVVDKCVSISF